MSQNGSFPQVGVKKKRRLNTMWNTGKNLVARRSYKGMNQHRLRRVFIALSHSMGIPLTNAWQKRAGIEDFLRCSCLFATIGGFFCLGDMFSLFNLNVSIVGVTVDLKKWCVVLDDEVSLWTFWEMKMINSPMLSSVHHETHQDHWWHTRDRKNEPFSTNIKFHKSTQLQ